MINNIIGFLLLTMLVAAPWLCAYHAIDAAVSAYKEFTWTATAVATLMGAASAYFFYVLVPSVNFAFP